MTALTFDTSKFVERLKAAGISETRAKAEVEAPDEALSLGAQELATKADIKIAITELRADIIKRMVSLSLAQLGMMIGILLKLS